jgi:hypothetical protein
LNDDVLAAACALRADLRFSDSSCVDALPNDRDSLIQLVRRNSGVLRVLRLEDDLGSAGKVEAKLGREGRKLRGVRGNGRRKVVEDVQPDETENDDSEPRQGAQCLLA